jgi:hypothetical protein
MAREKGGARGEQASLVLRRVSPPPCVVKNAHDLDATFHDPMKYQVIAARKQPKIRSHFRTRDARSGRFAEPSAA